jgi:hypothetical protein
MKSIKNINFKLTKIETTILIAVVVILGGAGTYLLTHLKTSYASGYTYSYLGESVWNPKLTQYYQDSDFYSYACKNTGSSSDTADVVVAMVASSYESDMESGAYVPSATVEINNTKIYNLGSSWNFNGVFATGTSVDHPGAWLRATNSLVGLPVTDTISMGPLATAYWPTVQTQAVSIASLSNCQVATNSVTASPPIISTPISTPTQSTSSTTITSTNSPANSTSSSSTTTKSNTTSTTSSSSASSNSTTLSTGATTTLSKSVVSNETAKIASSTVDPSQSIASIALPASTSSNDTFLDQSDWFWPSLNSGYSQFDTAVSPIIDGSSDGYLYGSRFYFNQASNSYTGYVGLETQGQTPAGKVAIFSITGASASSGPGVNSSSTYSGLSTYSSVIKYSWSDNLSYDLKVSLTAQSASTNTWTATVTNFYSGISTTIGSIVTPAGLGLFYNQSETFTERYSGVDVSCNGIDQAEVEFSQVSANNSVSPTTHLSTTPTQTVCPSNYETEDMPGQVIQIVW